MATTTQSKSIDSREVEKFTAMAKEWWDPNGKFKPLHKFNPVRIAYIQEKIAEHFMLTVPEATPLQGVKILDVGCGGGLLSEPLARLGAQVTAIDAGEQNIAMARLHAEQEGLEIDYRHTSVEALAQEGKSFDVVLAMEVVEHVADVESFLAGCAALVKPDGLMFLATLNRTVKSYGLAIIGAEYILRWLPRGTHSWKKFLRPSEMEAYIRAGGLSLRDLQGVSYHLRNDEWQLSDDVSVNYMVVAERPHS